MGLFFIFFIAGALVGGAVTFLLMRRHQHTTGPVQIATEATSPDAIPPPPSTPPEDSKVVDLDAQRMAAAARIRDQRAASRAHREAQRIATEAEAQREAQRIAAEAEAHREAQRIAAEAEAHREAQRIAAEAETHREAQRIAAEAEAQREAQRIAAEAEAQREAQRIAAEAEAHREAQRIAAEAEAHREAQRIAAEAEAQREAQRIAAEAEAQREAQRIAAEQSRHVVATKPPKTPEETMVMIVDDSKVGRIKTNRFLLNNQFQVQMAEDGRDAVQKIAAHMPDIVITDVEMPVMDGFELTEEIRRNPATAHLPVIIISGNNDGYATRAQEVGADLILGKPYSETDMVAHLHRFMQNGR